MSRQKYSSIAQTLVTWFSHHARDLPWRRTLDPYGIWVSEIMLQQTQVKTVMPYWERWMKALPTIKALARARPERVLKLWEGLGYYTRARNLQRAAKILCETYDGTFPRRFDDVLALPGIGRYTAGAICSIAYNQPTPVLDGNTIRVLCRLFAIGQNPRELKIQKKLWSIAETLVVEASKMGPQRGVLPHIHHSGNCSRLNQALMELGAVICTPRNPVCAECPVKAICGARVSRRVHELPRIGPPVQPTPRRVAAFVVQNRGLLLVRQRPAGVVNAHLWEFPNVELPSKQTDLVNVASALFKAHVTEVEHLCTIRHTITRYRIALEVYRVTSKRAVLDGATCWAKNAKLRQLPFTAAHRKILSIVTIT